MGAARGRSEVRIQGRVLKYGISALMEDFAGGEHRSHDATTLQVLSPPGLKDTRMVIYHDTPADPQSLWREVGATIDFNLDAELLVDGVQIFSGAARDLQRAGASARPGD